MNSDKIKICKICKKSNIEIIENKDKIKMTHVYYRSYCNLCDRKRNFNKYLNKNCIKCGKNKTSVAHYNKLISVCLNCNKTRLLKTNEKTNYYKNKNI